MKPIFFFLIFFLVACGYVYADEDFVTADKLSIADVEVYANKVVGNQPNFKLLGIHQEGNSATLYYHYQKRGFAAHLDQLKLIRFNAGKWYCPEKNEFAKSK